MIKDKKLGLKIAENPEEALWESFRKRIELAIKINKDELAINEEILKMCEKKLKSINK